jgi:hypothetical protein
MYPQITFCLLFFVDHVNSVIDVLVYNIPGMYVLIPNDYQHAKELIVEIWGAGGGGGASNIVGNYGGGGGSYIKALIKTNQQSFNVAIGSGGIGGNYDNGYMGQNGTPSYFINNINIQLIAGGGYGSGLIDSYYSYGNGGIPISLYADYIYIQQSG